MSWQDFHWELFLDLIAEMPDIEAVEEIDTRMQRVKDDRMALGDTSGKEEERLALNTEEDNLRKRRAYLIDRIEKRKWSKAVRALYGEEGIVKCIEWMRSLPEDQVKAIAVRRSNVKGGASCTT